MQAEATFVLGNGEGYVPCQRVGQQTDVPLPQHWEPLDTPCQQGSEVVIHQSSASKQQEPAGQQQHHLGAPLATLPLCQIALVQCEPDTVWVLLQTP